MTTVTTQTIDVLIADDHTMVRKGLKVLLGEFDDIRIVGEAIDGEHAVKLCQDLCPDVVLMDVMMSRMNGIEATKKLKSLYPNLSPVIGLSANASEEAADNFIKQGMDDYLSKPFDAKTLRSVIDSLYEPSDE